MAEFPGVYTWPRADAQAIGNLVAWEKSFRENVACARDIEIHIRNAFDGHEGIKEGCARAVLDRWGFKRTKFVLSNTLADLPPTAPINQGNRQWCAEFFVPQDHFSRYFQVDTAYALLDSFISQTREEFQKLDLFDERQCDPDVQEYEGRVLILSPESLEESYWNQEAQLWYAHDGFGCSPTARGRSIRCTCLGDGEQTRWDRSDFTGAAREDLLPDWAREQAQRLRDGLELQTLRQDMPAMTM